MNMRDRLYHIGVSGGKDSGALLIWMVNESGIPHEQLRATFCDTGNEIDETYNQVRLLSERVFPVEWLKPELDFYELARKKKRFPSTKARFCTQDLKMKPTKAYIDTLIGDYDVIGVSGVRADESFERSKLPEWGDPMESYFGIKEWRPLLNWTIVEVVAIHKKYGIPMNELYGKGAKRVGCFPCIMSRKAEIRNIAENWPERIDFLRSQEWPDGMSFHSFFARNKVPLTHRTKEITTSKGEKMMVATIDDVVAWTKTKDHKKTNQRQFVLPFWFDDDSSDDAGLSCPSSMGACE